MSAVLSHSESVYRKIHQLVPPGTPLRRGVFLDRDGVVTEDPGYLHRPEDIRFIPGSIDAIARLNREGWPVVLVTNQSGIGRGFYGWGDFELVQQCLQDRLTGAGAWLDAEWACGYHADASARTAEPDSDASRYRKPGTGMILEASLALSIDLPVSCLIGDKISDIEAAVRAGVGTAVHVLTGEGSSDRPAVEALLQNSASPCRILLAGSLAEAIPMLGATWS